MFVTRSIQKLAASQTFKIILILIVIGAGLFFTQRVHRQHNNENKMINMKILKVMQPHWPTKNVDPTKIVTIGDWALLQNQFATLVELSSKSTVRPALAESWTQTNDGKTWTFSLGLNRKWSDGSQMTLEQVLNSLKRSMKGVTAHTSLGAYVTDISMQMPNKIIFKLDRLPKNFLISLAMVDFGIVHPTSYSSSEFTWDAPVSGPYQIEYFSENSISMKKNNFFWDAANIDFDKVTIDRGMQSEDDFIKFTSENYDAAQLGIGILSSPASLESLKNSHKVFTASIDMNATLIFSRKRTVDGQLTYELRNYLLQKMYSNFWKNNWNDPTRSVGLRPPGTYGSLSINEFNDQFNALKIQNSFHFAKPIQILFGEHHKSLPIYKKIHDTLTESKIPFKEVFYPSRDLSKNLHAGNFDLMLVFQGAAEAEPDSAWRMFNSPNMAKPAASAEELDAAMLETDPKLREQMYKVFEKRILSQALSIPLKLERTHVVTANHIKMDLDQAAHWGLQIYKLRASHD